jgi:FG-GAP-like repeat
MNKSIALLLLTLVLTACGGSGGGGSPSTSTVTGSKSLSRVLNFSTSSIRNIAVGDLNNDGLEDVVIGGWAGPGQESSIHVLLQNADGTMSDRTTSILPVTSYTGSQRIFIRDFDGDGKNDIFIPGFNDGCVSGCSVHSMVFWNQAGQFAQQLLPELIDSHGACVDDINNDGRPDVLVRGAYDPVTHSTNGGLYINNGGRSFTLTPGIESGSTCSITHEPNNTVTIVTGNPNTFSTYDQNLNLISSVNFASQDPAANDLIDSLALDVNGDGAKDFILMFNNPSDNTKGRKEVWVNDGSGHYSYSYTIDQDNCNLYHYRVIDYNGAEIVYFSGVNLQAKLYRLQNGQFTEFNQSRFTDMAQQAGYRAGFTWSVDVGVVYRNSMSGKLFMLQSINGILYSEEM